MKKLFLLIALCTTGFYSFGTYCTPSWYGSGCSIGVSLATPSHPLSMHGYSGSLIDSGGCSSAGYYDRTSMSCTVLTYGYYTIYTGNSTSYGCSYQAWIDYNNNGTFETSESVGGSNPSTMTPVITFSILVNTTAASVGSHRLRVAVIQGMSYPSLPPCGTSSYVGEIRDYTVNISGSALGVSAVTSAENFSVFPNPANEELNIKMDVGTSANVVISNSMGSVVMQQAVTSNQAKLNIKNLPAGVYDIKLTNEAGSAVKRFVKL